MNYISVLISNCGKVMHTTYYQCWAMTFTDVVIQRFRNIELAAILTFQQLSCNLYTTFTDVATTLQCKTFDVVSMLLRRYCAVWVGSSFKERERERK